MTQKAIILNVCGLGVGLNLPRNYLLDRLQLIGTIGGKSETSYIEYGVPQGAILEPLFSLICIKDITN